MIRVLEKYIADKIAAGEVIERPVSIVKELVENSIDSGAKEIIIDIHNGGKTYIRVVDDGSGIPSKEVETAFLRHGTSKIETIDDLDSIGTLGFRGEALASICAVTRTKMITRTKEEEFGTEILIHGSNILKKSKTGCKKGTTIIIEDLFYNTPAREKFLKSDATESKKIIEFLSHIAITRPDIKFRLVNNGKTLFSTLGQNHLLDSILKIYKEREYENLLELEEKKENIEIRGYISKPSLNRKTKRNIFISVNGRVIKSKLIEDAIMKGYKERLFENRYPVIFLFLKIDPKKLDVNIHPNKKEIRFSDEKEVSEFIENAISKKLISDEGAIDLKDTYKYQKVEREVASKERYNAGYEESKKEKQVNLVEYKADSQMDLMKYLKAKRIEEEKRIYEPCIEEKQKEQSESIGLAQEFHNQEDNNEDHNIEKIEKNFVREEKDYKDFSTKSSSQKLTIEKPISVPFDFSDLKFKTIVFNTYIITEGKDTFYIIDQHAAHERVFYEKLVTEYNESKKKSQILVLPFTFDLPVSLEALRDEFLENLKELGYTLESFGYSTYRVLGIPEFMTISEGKSFLKEFMEEFSEEYKLKNYKVIDKLITKSCKKAIKANDKVSELEAISLLNQLKGCKNPFSCPHGRPTFLRFSKYDIERMFKRS